MLKKEQMRRWLTERLQTQKQLVMAAMAGMAVIGTVATLIEFVLFYLIIRIGFIQSGVLAMLATLGILATIQYFTLLWMPKQLADIDHESVSEDEVTIVKSAATMSAAWTYAFGSLESDRTWVEILLGLLSLPQRMFAAAWFSWQRKGEIEAVEIAPCALILRLLHKEAERVDLKKITEEVELTDLTQTLRQVSLIDGVVFLTRNSVGLSLANRLVDDIEAWRKKNTEPQ
ncbi:MAG: hypothetical protein NT138_22645 [Planctomycetales bacterium]|jgi:hypothetical protein|nr:hypothetical protein [Planctomycetales bacterium]